MHQNNVKPGDIVVSDFEFYQHWAIVSDKRCEKGRWMLISATDRNGTVKEEPWDVVTQNKHTYPKHHKTDLSVDSILERARSKIDKWKYAISSRNCEHFAKWATGVEVTSTQVTSFTTAAIIGAGATALISEKPTFLRCGMVGLGIGTLALYASKAPERSQTKNRPRLIY